MARSHWSDDSMGCSRFLGSIKFLHSQFLYWCISHITAINWKYQLFLSLGMRIITLYLLCLFWHYYVLLKKPLHPRPQQGGGGGCINISTSWRAGKRREESHSHTVNSRCNARAFLLALFMYASNALWLTMGSSPSVNCHSFIGGWRREHENGCLVHIIAPLACTSL